MPKRTLKPCSNYSAVQPMEKRAKKNELDPLIAITHNHASFYPKFSFQTNTKSRRTAYKSERANQVKITSGIVPNTHRSQNGIQQINHDTFQLMESNPSPRKRVPVVHKPPSKPVKTPLNQSTSSSVGYKAHQSLVNRRRSIQDVLMPEAPLQSNVFISVTGDQMANFFHLLESATLVKFMRFDVCLRVTDKYLLAMAFAYFARAKLATSEFTVLNFFVALYLAHDVEEDEEDYKYEIFPWALGKTWRLRYKHLLKLRDQLWKRMQYKAIVSRKCCDEIMAIEPDHPIWKRERKVHHAGAIRPWLKERHDDGKLIGPDGSPRHCDLCNYPPRPTDSDHDSLSPDNDRLWLQMDSSSSSLEEYIPANITNASSVGTAPGFSMNDMQRTLMYSSNSAKNSSGRGLSVTGDTTLDWVDCFSDTGDETANALRRAEM